MQAAELGAQCFKFIWENKTHSKLLFQYNQFSLVWQINKSCNFEQIGTKVIVKGTQEKNKSGYKLQFPVLPLKPIQQCLYYKMTLKRKMPSALKTRSICYPEGGRHINHQIRKRKSHNRLGKLTCQRPRRRLG